MERVFVECAVRAALIAVVTAVVLRMIGVKPAAARHTAWTSVMLTMLLLPVWTVWGPKAPIRLLPPEVWRETIGTRSVTTSNTPLPKCPFLFRQPDRSAQNRDFRAPSRSPKLELAKSPARHLRVWRIRTPRAAGNWNRPDA